MAILLMHEITHAVRYCSPTKKETPQLHSSGVTLIQINTMLVMLLNMNYLVVNFILIVIVLVHMSNYLLLDQTIDMLNFHHQILIIV